MNTSETAEVVAEARKAANAAATAYARDPHPFYRESWEKYAEALREAEVAHENAQEAEGIAGDDEKRAAKRQELIDAHEAYDKARNALGLLLAQSTKTKDGQTFNVYRMQPYYHVSDGFWDPPRLTEVRFYQAEFFFDRDGVVTIQAKEGSQRTNYPINSLYADRTAADIALCEVMVAWLGIFDATYEAVSDSAEVSI